MYYVLCPGYYKTGGSELLHQLVYEINKNNGEAGIVYIDTGKGTEINPEFKKYISKSYVYNDIIDDSRNTVIVPEVYTGFLRKIKNAKTYVWWESVDFYLEQNYKVMHFKWIIKKILIKIFKSKVKISKGVVNIPKKLSTKELKSVNRHLIQSYYAGEYLKNHNIQNYTYLSDYINEIYFEKNNEVDIDKKQDIVCYNPKKGYKFTKKIIDKMTKVNFVPIENMTNNEVVDLLQKSKLYIDFGNHPGKDRFPREAASQYCCVITNKKGSAKFYNDVMIPDKYKYEDSTKNIENIADAIINCLENYKQCIDDFSDYRKFILCEKNKFAEDVKSIFIETT